MNVRRYVRIVWLIVAAAMLMVTGYAIAQVLPPGLSLPTASPAAQAPSAPASTQPTTAPTVTVVVNADGSTSTTTVAPDGTVAGATKLLSDRLNKLTLDEILDPKYWMSFVFDAIRWTVGFIPRLIVAIFILCFFWLIYRIVRKLIISSMKAAGVDESIRDMLSHLLKWAVLGFGMIIAGNQIGLEIAALLTGVSIIGLAVGFAAQESLSNFIAGIMIFLDKPFKVGDWIEIDGHLAEVRRVTFRSTRMVDLDGDVVVMPNVSMLSNKLVNKSTNSITRCRVQIGIAYGASIDVTRTALLKLVNTDTRIEKTPAPRVDVLTLNASSVDVELRFWIKDEAFEDAMKHEYTEKAKLALDAAGIEIPFPHMQVLVEKTEALEMLANRVA